MSAPKGAHAGDDDLVLHFYGEAPRAPALDAHLDECAGCRSRWDGLRRTLAAVTAQTATDEQEPGFSVDRAWAALAPRLAADRRRSRLRGLLVPLAVAASLVVAFAVGRRWPAAPPDAAAGSERILLVAVGDHLERSEMLLVELVNAPPDRAQIGPEQVQAQELVGASRLYRAAMTRAGEPGLASVLEEIERLLVEVAHRPAAISAEELATLRRRIESRGLIFKVRVLEWQVREKQKEAAPGVAVS